MSRTDQKRVRKAPRRRPTTTPEKHKSLGLPKVSNIEIVLGVVGASILMLWLLWASSGASIAHRFLNGAAPAESAAWGDSFGSFNALIGALGFAGVLMTLLMQRRALQSQQLELARQQQDQHRQQFESAFFQLLGLMRDIRSEIFFKYSDAYIASSSRKAVKVAKGAEALARAAREVAYWIREKEKVGQTLTSDELARIYTVRVHGRNETRFGPYYRIIYTILRRISEDKVLSEAEKQKYGNLLRSQLQSREVVLIALNGLSPMSNDLKKYLIEFRIMKYLPTLTMKKSLLSGYPKEAFEARD